VADIASAFTLVTPGGTVIFNEYDITAGGDEVFWITRIEGLDGVDIRAPIDVAPVTDGGLGHDAYESYRSMTWEGVLFIDPARHTMNQTREIRNDMEATLMTALLSIYRGRGDGALTWTPLGHSERGLTVNYINPKLQFGNETFEPRSFVFGLVALIPGWSGTT
jgi:hypothetical protein